MAVTKTDNENIKILKVKIQSGKVVIGTDRVMKALKSGSLEKVCLASNCRADVEKDIQYYAGLVNIPVIKLDQNNEELGVLCKKNFFVAVLGTLGE